MKIRKILIKNRIIILFILIFFINCTKKINNKNLEKRNSTVDLKEKYLNYGIDLENVKDNLVILKKINNNYFINFKDPILVTCKYNNNNNIEKIFFENVNLNEIYNIDCISNYDKNKEYLKWFINLKSMENYESKDLKNLPPKLKKQIETISIDEFYRGDTFDINEIIEFKNLKNITVVDKKLKNFNKMENFLEIEEINLDSVEIVDSDLSIFDNKLNNFTKLMKFKIFDVKEFKNINILNNSPNLKILNIAGVENIKNIDILKNFKNLEEVDISNNKISDISPLKNSKNIRILSISNNLVKDIEVIKNFKNLKEIYIPHNKIKDLTPLKSLEFLEYILLDDKTSITEIKKILPKRLYKNAKIYTDDAAYLGLIEVSYEKGEN
ncbi:leucine-rich repeat domain-containing protein [Leptotrichia sp. oral taxon 417]|uniref:leucine-rich repeat domain-containing protein n=1 Tax=Leptotrichia sp. oral taxon 417 TaxID=712365 RepID=UPI0015BD129B|nr:leucine-rich repeat domain-containing protein [Leptotrichia sp. oral taxon 417]NWO27930.1 leucine-rich repeat domain-containing protein [Leptotrichia sp. oral taxon 417]